MTTDIVKTLKAALLPCPFCGGDAETRHERTGQRWHWCVVCTASDTQCAVGPETQWHDAEADAIAAWNRRALLAQGRGEVVEARNVRKEGRTVVIICDSYEEVDRVYRALKHEASDEGKARDHGDGKAE